MSSELHLSPGIVQDLISCQTVIDEGAVGVVGSVPWGDNTSAVIKILKDKCPEDYFRREVFFLNFLNGFAGAPRLLGVSETSPRALVMTNQGSQTLRHVLLHYNLPDWVLIRIGIGIISRLQELHAVGVLHNDIHAGNIMVDLPEETSAPPVIRLIDFGQAAATDKILEHFSGDLERKIFVERRSSWFDTPVRDIHMLGETFLRMMDKMEEVSPCVATVVYS